MGAAASDEVITSESLIPNPTVYSPVQWSSLFEIKLKGVILELWKLNLLAIHSTDEGDILFVAQGSEVLVYPLSVTQCCKLDSLKEPARRINLHNGQADINQLRIAKLNGKTPVLLVVDDGGEVRLFFLDDLQRDPLSFSNGIGTWGVAISPATNSVAVSANSHNITIWNISETGHQKITLKGHQHNIPAIDFSPCGKFIASISIDSTVRVWNYRTKKAIHKLKLGDHWGWGVRWIPANSVKLVDVEEHQWDNSKRRLLQLFPVPFHFRLTRADEELDGGDEELPDSEGEREQATNSGELEDATVESAAEVGKEELFEEERESQELLLCTTFHHLILCDSSLNVLATLYNAIRRPPIPVDPMMAHMARISLVEYIPELSLALVGSQGCAVVMLARVIRNVHTGKYEFLPEKLLPETPQPSAIVGMTVTPFVNKECPELSFFRVYILYQTKQMYCYELRRSSVNPLDICTKIL